MFIGVSKNIGGFRVGIGTALNTEPTAKEVKDAEFKKFLKLMGEKTFSALADFINSSGYDYNKLNKYDIDMDTLFVGSSKYDEFSSLLKELEKIIRRILEIEDYGIVAKRKISDHVYKIVDFTKDYVENYQKYLDEGLATKSIEIDYSALKKVKVEYKPKKVGLLLGIGIFFFPYIFAWITLIPGYSKKARIISFAWLVFILFIISSADPVEKKEVIEPSKIETKNK